MSALWQTKKIKFCDSVIMGQSPDGKSVNSDGDGIPFLQGNAEFTDIYPVAIHSTTEPGKLCEEGDILLSVRAPVGAVNVADKSYAIGRGLCAIRPVSHNRTFLRYLLKTKTEVLNSIATGTTFTAVSAQQVGNTEIEIPPLSDQSRIATYLDEQTTKIDRLMEMRRQQMELLKEQRASIIQETVTRGLNHDVPMKDSGIPWLGEIPAHWSVTTLGRLATLLQTGPFGSQLHSHEYVEDGIPIINPSHMAEGMIQHDPKCTVDEETARRLSRHFLKLGDIVFARRGEIGRCALVHADEVGWLCGTGSLLMRPDTRVLEPAFLVTLFQLKHLKESLTLQSVGSTMDNLNTGILAGTRLPLPPREEQSEILQFIKNKSAKTEDLIFAYARQITLLAEYRAALIHECVTGQREV